MPVIRLRSETIAERTAYHAVRRAQGSIAQYCHFRDGDLSRYLSRDSFATVAGRLADKYFHKSRGMAIWEMATEIYHVLLIMAPIVQRLQLSTKYDWHRGHVLSWFRVQCSNRRKRYHAVREIERAFQPDLLGTNLAQLGVHDSAMMETILELYRRHCGGRTLKDLLAHQLFDPIIMMNVREGYELRHGNRLYRLEKDQFAGSVDIRTQLVSILDFSLTSSAHKTGRFLEVRMADVVLKQFQDAIKSILDMPAAPQFKLQRIEVRIRDLVERTRPARSAWPQVLELKRWLGHKLQKLAGTVPEAKLLPHLLANLWLQRSDHRLHLKSPSFFYDISKYDEKTYLMFFSPYREV
jgi:hypothetical protein